MDTLLKSLLGKSKRPMIINGSLAKLGQRSPILASLSGYSLVFETGGSVATTIEKDEMLEAIQEEMNNWDAKYNDSHLVSAARDKDYCFKVDNFTGALIIQSPLFQVLADVANHNPDRQQPAVVKDMLKSFVADYTIDYFEVFLYLLNRRITAQHMPVRVKGHLTGGFFQPVIVETDGIKSPFGYPEFGWLFDDLNKRSVTLEYHTDSSRKLDLTCIAMCDLSEFFGIRYPVVELDRRIFLLMLSMTSLSQLDIEKANKLGEQYSKLFAVAVTSPLERALRDSSRILTDEDKHRLSLRNPPELFSSMMNFARGRNRAAPNIV